MIILKNITKTYNQKTTALKIDQLTLDSTGIVSIIGDNGSGKSTLLNIIGLLDMQFNGQYSINSLLIEKHPIRKLRGQVFEYIFQDLNLIEDISIRNNITLKSSLYNLPTKNDDITDEQQLKRRPKELSGGERQLQAIHRILYSNAQVVICDEPTANLDVSNKRSVFEKLQALATSKLVLLVSHDIELVKEFSDRIITLKNGEITSDVLVKQTEPLNEIVVKPQKINYRPIIKLALTYMKNHFMKLMSMTSLSLIFLMLTLTLISFINFDLANAVSTVLQEDTYVTVEQRVFEKFEFYDYETYITSNQEFLQMTNNLLSSDYDVIIENIRFTDTVTLNQGEALINKDYFTHYFNKDVIDDDIFIVDGINRYELKLVGFTNEEGLVASKSSLIKSLNLFSKPTIEGGLFLNSMISDDYDYLTKHIKFISFSQLKNMIGFSYDDEIMDNEILLSSDLYQYVEESSLGAMIYFNDYKALKSNKLYDSIVKIHEYFPNGAIYKGKVTHPVGKLFTKTIVVSDEIFEQLIEEISYFDALELRVSKDNKHRIANFIATNKLDSQNPELGFLLNHPAELTKLDDIVYVVIALFVVATTILLVNYSNEVILNKKIEIGLLQTYGLSKIGSILSTLICILVPLVSVIILGLTLSFGLFEIVNTTMNNINNQYSFKVLVLTNEHIIIYSTLILMIFITTSVLAMIKISKLSPKNIFLI